MFLGLFMILNKIMENSEIFHFIAMGWDNTFIWVNYKKSVDNAIIN